MRIYSTKFFKIITLTGFMFMVTIQLSIGQTAWPSVSWANATNLTGVMDTNGVTELSGLHWNPELNRLYAISDDGVLYVLQLNTTTNTFSRIAYISGLGGPEGVTQVDYATNEFYTVDENNYQIRKYTHATDFSNVVLANTWNLLAPPSPMTDTGNTGPEGIAFVPDSYLSTIGFISSATGSTYTSKKGMGGLIFIAHQKKGYVWVFDVNPNVSNDFTYVGKYKTNEDESCDLEFDRSTGLLYILHNTGSNYLEVTDLSTGIVSSDRKFVIKKEYYISNPSGNTNIEGFAITPKCADSTHVSAWLCRDVASDESSSYLNDCLRWFTPFTSEGTCVRTSVEVLDKDAEDFKIYPNPPNNQLIVTLPNQISGLVSIKLFSITGQLALSENFQAKLTSTIDITNLIKGIYLVEINQEGKLLIKMKIVKN
jgi:hypothetical protein